MACTLSGRGLDAAPALSTSAETDTTALSARSGFAGAAMAPTLAVADLEPPWRPHPRPWQRMAVPAGSKGLGLRTVWKKAGSIPTSLATRRYVQGLLELQADGLGPRKARRGARHVPAWGDGRWAAASASGEPGDEAGEEAETERRDAAEEASGSAGLPAAEGGSGETAGSEPRAPSVVPRKRNSRRQPLLALRVPPATSEAAPTKPESAQEDVGGAAASPESFPVERDLEHITKRAKRRMSRRISMMPRPTTLPYDVSPPKRRLSTPAALPCQGVAAAARAEGEEASAVGTPAAQASTRPSLSDQTTDPDAGNVLPHGEDAVGFSPLSTSVVFDQPAAEISLESPQEIRQRISLHNTRRRETIFSVVERRRTSAEPEGRQRGRRHSFSPLQAPLVFQATGAKKANRRHTFQPGATDAFPSRPASPAATGVPSIAVFASEDETSRLDLSAAEDQATPPQDETVVVDVRTNLDIFGSGPPVQTHHVLAELPVSPCSPVEAAGETGHGGATDYGDKEASAFAKGRESTALRSVLADLSAEEADQRRVSSDMGAATAPPADALDEGTPPYSSPMDESASEASETSETTNDACLVSALPASDDLDTSLLLPLPETVEETVEEVAEGEDRWPSPTAMDPGFSAAHRCEAAELLSSHSGFDGYRHAARPCEDDTASAAANAATVDDIFAELTADMRAGSESPWLASPAEESHELDPFSVAPMPFAGEDTTVTMTLDLNKLDEEEEEEEGEEPLAAQDDWAQEDSETEMLRRFVTRVKAGKSAKAEAAAATAAAAVAAASARSKAHMRSKRGSGSTGSSGSPVSRIDCLSTAPFDSLDNRAPLRAKDHNMSPSPTKKRKGHGGDGLGENHDARDLLSKPSLDDSSPARPKRRRKKMEADTGGIFNPAFLSSRDEASSVAPSGPRRSQRTRAKPPPAAAAAAAAAGGSALSLIPVRLPGSLNLNGDDSYGLSTSSLSLRRNDERDLAAVTRVNTRKNKGNADPPCVVVARQTYDGPQAAHEQASVFDSPLPAARPDDETHHARHRKANKTSKCAKSVHWAETLVNFQASEGSSSSSSASAILPEPASSSASPPDETDAQTDGGDAAGPAAVAEGDGGLEARGEAAPPAASAAAAEQGGEPDKTGGLPRRTTRVSRLQPPTPRKALASAAKSALPTVVSAAATDASAAGPKSGLASRTSVRRMATRRAKVVGLGMAGNGTPAPKKRATRFA